MNPAGGAAVVDWQFLIPTGFSILCAVIAYVFIEKTTRWQIGHLKDHEKLNDYLEQNRRCSEQNKRDIIKLSSAYEERCKNSEDWHVRNDDALKTLAGSVDRLINKLDGKIDGLEHRLTRVEAQIGHRRTSDDRGKRGDFE